MRESRFRIGIDEAGFGPRLGPFVVALVRTDGPGIGLGEALADPADGTPPIDDSKQLYRGDLRRLEVTALAALACARGARPRTLAALLEHPPAGLAAHPWYAALDLPLPIIATRQEVDRAAAALWRTLRSAGVGLATAAVRPILEGEFNGRVQDSGNKSRLELEVIEALLAGAVPPHPIGRVDCDRLGGRKSYGDWLAAQFPFWSLETVEERPSRSAYILAKSRYRLDVAFHVDGERQVKEIALASCLAKYVREAMMLLFNRFWAARRKDLRPTAGYPVDAERFLAELAGDALLEAHRHRLVRVR